MLSHCRVCLQPPPLLPLLLLLLLLVTETQAQSGDGGTDMELRVSCTSDISKDINSLTCQLLGARNDNDDDEDNGDSIERMSLCYKDWDTGGSLKCLKGSGQTMNFTQSPLNIIDLTVHLKSGRNITTQVKPMNIVKPRSPRVQNVTFTLESKQAVIYIQTPYHNDYLKVENQLFQLHIGTAGSEMTQNISGSNNIKISMDHLQRNAQYYVRVQAIPVGSSLHGSWSEWSETFTFITPEGVPNEIKNSQEVYILIVCLISLVVVTSSVVFLSKNKIFAYMWPSIPHPKHTLVQICKPNKGLLLNLKPEVFSALKVYPMEETEEDQGEDMLPSVNAAAAGNQSNNPSSTQSSDCRSTTSISTEELELSTLLSRSSSNGEDSLQSTSPSPINVLLLGEVPIPQPEGSSGGNQVELFGVGQQEEAYVTMSSFYQIK